MKKLLTFFEIMPSDEVADILEEIEEDRVEKLLTQMDTESQGEIRELMEYERETVGSIMSKDFLTFLPDVTVSEVLKWIEDNSPDEEEVTIYILQMIKIILLVYFLYFHLLLQIKILNSIM